MTLSNTINTMGRALASQRDQLVRAKDSIERVTTGDK